MSDAGEDLFPERFLPEQMHGLIEAEHLARYQWAATLARGADVLDAGCGVGYGLQIAQAAGARSLAGVDVAPQAVMASRRLLGQSARIEVGDLASLPFEQGSFDLVLCFETIEHVADQERALQELRRVLRADGLLAISSPNPDVYPAGNPYHTHEYTPDELELALQERFANVALASQHTWLASLICDRRDLRIADVKRPMEVLLYKIAALAAGQETFAVALASDRPLPALLALATLTTPQELDAWRKRALSAERHLHDAREQMESAAQRLGSAEAQLAELRAASADAIRAAAARRTERDEALAALAKEQQRAKQRELAIERLRELLAKRNAALRPAAGSDGQAER